MNAQSLVPVAAGKVADTWPSIRPMLERLRARFNERWLPEHVFMECVNGTSYLWTTPDLCGFVVLQVIATPYARDLHVWIACNETGARAGDYLSQIKAIAAENDCQSITFESDRIGWLRELPNVQVRKHYSIAVGG